MALFPNLPFFLPYILTSKGLKAIAKYLLYVTSRSSHGVPCRRGKSLEVPRYQMEMGSLGGCIYNIHTQTESTAAFSWNLAFYAVTIFKNTVYVTVIQDGEII